MHAQTDNTTSYAAARLSFVVGSLRFPMLANSKIKGESPPRLASSTAWNSILDLLFHLCASEKHVSLKVSNKHDS